MKLEINVLFICDLEILLEKIFSRHKISLLKCSSKIHKPLNRRVWAVLLSLPLIHLRTPADFNTS